MDEYREMERECLEGGIELNDMEGTPDDYENYLVIMKYKGNKYYYVNFGVGGGNSAYLVTTDKYEVVASGVDDLEFEDKELEKAFAPLYKKMVYDASEEETD